MSRETSILIGLDGIDWSEIDEWISDGTLENFQKLCQEGTTRDLISTHPPWTPCAWPSLLSGRNPGKHGAFDFFNASGYDKNMVRRTDVDSPFLYEVADSQDFTPVVINYPITHPATELSNGAIVPGYLSTESVSFHPPSLRADFEEEYGPYKIYPTYNADSNAVNEYVNVARSRRDMARFLDKRYDWDLLAVQFQVTDSIFHDLDDRNQIREILKRVDEFAGDIISLGDDDSDVFIVSDHGMGDYEWTFYVNSWLVDQGYAQTTTGEEQYLREMKNELKNDGSDTGTPAISKILDSSVDALTTIGLSPKRIHSLLSTVGLDKAVERILPENVLLAAQNQVIDHPNSIAYQLLFNSLGIHLNVKGREPDGIVSEEDYESVRSEIIERLKQVQDPDGKPVFEDVLPKEEVYHGPHTKDAPDILLIPRDYQYDVSGSIVDTFRKNLHKNHKPKGILLSNRDLTTSDGVASIYDIAPTVATALGLPVDERTDGTVLGPYEETEERVDWDEIAESYRKESNDDGGQSREVEDRLADLGYME